MRDRIMLKNVFLLVAAVFLLPLDASAQFPSQPAVIVPQVPTAADVIMARFDIPGGCALGVSNSVAGNVVRTTVTFSGCGADPFQEIVDTQFGPLPAGTYTYEIYYVFDDEPPVRRSTQTIVVAAAIARVPALSPGAAISLIFILAVSALFVLRRTGGA